jgi:hypothetical protein
MVFFAKSRPIMQTFVTDALHQEWLQGSHSGAALPESGGVHPIAYLDIIARRVVTAKLPAPISMALAAIVAGALWKGARPLASK